MPRLASTSLFSNPYLRSFTSLVSLGLPLLLSGCFAGTVGAVLGAISAADGDGDGSVNEPPAAPAIQTARRLDGDHVLLKYFLLDDEGGPLDVRVDWQPVDENGDPLDGKESFFPATRATEPVRDLAQGEGVFVSDPTTGIDTEPNRLREAVFVWKAREDLRERINEELSRVRVRIVAFEGPRRSEVGLSAPLHAGNEPPEVRSVEVDPDADLDPQSGAPRGIIPLRVTLSDSTADDVRLRVEITVGDQCVCATLEGDTASDSGGRECGTCGTGSLFETDEGRREHTIFWNSRRDLGRQATADARIRVAAFDVLDPDDGGDFVLPTEVDNNDNPIVTVDISSSLDNSFEVPIRLVVQDRESEPVTVVFQWAFQDEEFPALSIEASDFPPPVELDCLRKLLTLQNEAECFPDVAVDEVYRDLHVLSEAEFAHRGVVDNSADLFDSGVLATQEIRETDFARKGLAFHPPTLRNPEPGQERERDRFLIGRRIRFLASTGDDTTEWFRIVAFDPTTSEALLDKPTAVLPGMQYQVQATGGLVNLSSSPEGTEHIFVWDSLRDVEASRVNSRTRVNVRVVAFDDSQVFSSLPQAFDLENRFLLRAPILDTQEAPVAVAVGDVTGDGRQDVVVANSNANRLTVFPQDSTGTLLPYVLELDTGGEPFSVAIGNLDGDEAGRNDIVVANWVDATITVFSQDDSGKFSSQEIPVGLNPYSVAVGDVLGDDRDDLVVANSGDHTLSLFEQRDGSLVLVSTASTGLSPRSVAIGDVAGDGGDDVVVANWGDDTLSVFTFEEKDASRGVVSTLVTGKRPASVTIGDVDANGADDVIAANSTDNTVGVFRQFREGGVGTLAEKPWTLSTDASPVSVAVAELNGDFRKDLVVATSQRTLSVFLQEPSGTLPSRPAFSLLPEIDPITEEADGDPLLPGRFLATGDVNGDGRSDVVLVGVNLPISTVRGLVGVYLQRGLLSTQTLATGDGPADLEVGDVNGDGRSDIVVANKVGESGGTLSVYLQSLSGTLPSSPSPTIHLAAEGAPVATPSSIALGDMNGDGRSDVAVADQFGPEVRVYLQATSGALPEEPSLTVVTEEGVHTLAVGDVLRAAGSEVTGGGDGRNDIAVANSTGSVTLYLQREEPPHFLPAPSLTLGTDLPGSILIRDLSGDGRDDVVVVNQRLARVTVFSPNRAGEFTAATFETPRFPQLMAVGDLNGDGADDLAVASLDTLQVLFQGKGTLIPADPMPLRERPVDLAIGDVSGDGRSDLVVAHHFSSTVAVYPQNSAGHLTPGDVQEFDTGQESRPSAVAIGDVSGDGRNEIIVTNRRQQNEENTVTVFRLR